MYLYRLFILILKNSINCWYRLSSSQPACLEYVCCGKNDFIILKRICQFKGQVCIKKLLCTCVCMYVCRYVHTFMQTCISACMLKFNAYRLDTGTHVKQKYMHLAIGHIYIIGIFYVLPFRDCIKLII